MTLDTRRTGDRSSSWVGIALTAIIVTALVAGIGWILLTSELDGPGSARLSGAAEDSQQQAYPQDERSPDGQREDSGPTGDDRSCVASTTMPGGDNNYVPDAPVVADLGRGFVVSGTVRQAGSCEPAANVRIQIWMHTARGMESDPSNRGSVMTDAQGRYRLESLPVVPAFGQPHVHMAYDDDAYRSVFLRPMLDDEGQSSLTVDIVLEPR